MDTPGHDDFTKVIKILFGKSVPIAKEYWKHNINPLVKHVSKTMISELHCLLEADFTFDLDPRDQLTIRWLLWEKNQFFLFVFHRHHATRWLSMVPLHLARWRVRRLRHSIFKATFFYNCHENAKTDKSLRRRYEWSFIFKSSGIWYRFQFRIKNNLAFFSQSTRHVILIRNNKIPFMLLACFIIIREAISIKNFSTLPTILNPSIDHFHKWICLV